MNKRRRNRFKDPGSVSPSKSGWRVLEWSADVGISRAFTWKLVAAGEVDSVKIGNARIITTSPADYLASLAGEAA